MVFVIYILYTTAIECSFNKLKTTINVFLSNFI